MNKILKVQDLEVKYFIDEKRIYAVRKISFDLFEKQVIAFVGESGSGKTSIAYAILRLLDQSAEVSGKIIFENENILEKPKKDLKKMRGKKISIIFQDPFSSLNPTMKIGKQILEAIDDNPSKQKVYDLLKDVGILDFKLRFDQYPHQISGGMRQRVMIAIAIASRPKIIIADEPTSSLDNLYQIHILDLLKKINRKYNTSIIFINHNLSLVENIADKIFIIYAGEILARGDKNQIIYKPKHPYTKLLMQSFLKFNETAPIVEASFSPLKKEKLCLFYERCPYKTALCLKSYPPRFLLENDHSVLCHLFAPCLKVKDPDLAKKVDFQSFDFCYK